MVEDFFCKKQLDRTELHNNSIKYAFKDLFAKRIAYISTGLEISRYVQAIYKNWDNYDLNNAVEIDNKTKDDKNRNMKKKLLGDLNELYGIYN